MPCNLKGKCKQTDNSHEIQTNCVTQSSPIPFTFNTFTDSVRMVNSTSPRPVTANVIVKK